MAVGIWQKIVAPVPFPTATLAIGTYYSASPAGGVETAGTKTSYYTNDAWNSLETVMVIGTTTGTVVLTLQGFDPASGTWYTPAGAATSAMGSTTTTVTLFSPSTPVQANSTIPAIVPLRWRLKAVVAAASVPFSVGARLYRV